MSSAVVDQGRAVVDKGIAAVTPVVDRGMAAVNPVVDTLKKNVGFAEKPRGSRGSVHIGEDVKRGPITLRKSVAVSSLAVVGKNIQKLRQECAEDNGGDDEAPYREVVDEARECLGGSNAFKEFHEEWDAQLLIRCADSSEGHKVVLFCPFFLRTVLTDNDEMDRAFRFIMLIMDEIAMNKPYIFVYCFLGMDWSNPSLASRLRFAYDILPRKYPSNLKAFYVLHPTNGFRVSMWTFRPLLSKEFWDKIQYINSLDEICALLHPHEEEKRADLRRRFPFAVHRKDAEFLGHAQPVTVGVPLKQMCLYYGVDFVDKTTGKMYPRLPPAVIFLCEALEREGGEENFSVFDADASDIYRLVDIIDEGKPLERDMPPAALWCVLQMWVCCLPSPLFSFEAFDQLQQQKIKAGDIEAQRRFLIDLFHNHLSKESSYVALYLASFLHTMCQASLERQSEMTAEEAIVKTPLSASSAAQILAPGFIRPRVMTEDIYEVILDAVSLLETLINSAEEPDLWIGRREAPKNLLQAFDDSSDDDDDDDDDYEVPATQGGTADSEKGFPSTLGGTADAEKKTLGETADSGKEVPAALGGAADSEKELPATLGVTADSEKELPAALSETADSKKAPADSS